MNELTSTQNIQIIQADPTQAEALSSLAQQSKAHWGYSDRFMQAVVKELTYSQEQLENHPTYVACWESNKACTVFRLSFLHI